MIPFIQSSKVEKNNMVKKKIRTMITFGVKSMKCGN